MFISDASDSTKPSVQKAFADGATDSGSVSVYIPQDGYEKSSYIYLDSELGSISSSKRFTEIVFASSDVKFRDETGSQVTMHATIEIHGLMLLLVRLVQQLL